MGRLKNIIVCLVVVALGVYILHEYAGPYVKSLVADLQERHQGWSQEQHSSSSNPLVLYFKTYFDAASGLLWFFIVCTGFPPIIGYSIFLIACGKLYGLEIGFIIGYTASIVGSLACFSVGRFLFKERVQSIVKRNVPKHILIERAIKSDGLYMSVLLQLGPYPVNWLNLSFSISSLSLKAFLLSKMFVAVLLVSLTVYLGTVVPSLDDIYNRNIDLKQSLLFGITLLFRIMSSWVLYRKLGRVLSKYENAGTESSEDLPISSMDSFEMRVINSL